MKTIVLQSFRQHDVPWWLGRCMNSVAEWAKQAGWQYQFQGDAFFDLAPEWVHKRCTGNIYALTDVCRLQWLLEQLDAGYERVIWADADVLIFAPEQLDITSVNNHAFAHELFVHLESNGDITPVAGINNALMIFERSQTILDRYLKLSLSSLQNQPPGPVPRTALGPALLKELNTKDNPLKTINGVGLFTLAIMQELASSPGPLIRELILNSPKPPGAANLCHFLRNATPPFQRPYFDEIYNQAVSQLITTGRKIFNQEQ